MISKELARRFIERVSKHTDYNINIMDENGIIIASRDPDRIGNYHEIAYRIVHGNEDIMDTTGMRYPGVLPGINMVIEMDRHREGVVGVTGDPDEIRPIAMIVKMALETMLTYERRQEKLRLRTNKKEHMIYLLNNPQGSDLDTIRQLAADLGYAEDSLRIPVLLVTDGDAGLLLEKVRSHPLHYSHNDFSAVLDPRHVIIYKSVGSRGEPPLSMYREFIEEYLGEFFPVKNGRNSDPDKADDPSGYSVTAAYTGSFQDSFAEYSYAYRHCKWLEEHFPRVHGIVFFYDHAGPYLLDKVPGRELQNVFRMHTEGVKKDKLRQYLQTGETLLSTNFRFREAAELLYIHKNTMVYRYQALKSFLGIDPIARAEDRDILLMFCEFLRKSTMK